MRTFLLRQLSFVFLCTASFSALFAQTANETYLLQVGQQRQVITAQSQQQIIHLSQLKKDVVYNFIIPPDFALGSCLPDAEITGGSAIQLSYTPLHHALRFQTTGTTAQIKLVYPCSWPANDPPRHYVSLNCADCTAKPGENSLADMAVLEVEGAGAEELIKEVFIGGDCFDVTGVTLNGGGDQIGKFFNGLTNIGFETGMIIATGDIGVAPGPNDQNGAGGGGTGGGDADLSGISSGALFDVAAIEFDFTPTQTPLTFDYVFASEEYCEYVNTQFNDVFGFFISGPGIPGGTQNLAVIPTTNIPITINTVNHVTNSGLYAHNTPAGLDNCENGGVSGTLPPVPPAGGPGPLEVQFDGFTRRMTAVAQVIPCSTYHIKLAIADVGDGLYDSAVFLKAGSFDGGGNASIEWLVNGEPDVDEVVEGCGTVQILVDRIGSNLNVPLPVSFTITGTATSGADFSPIPATIIIPTGQDQVLFPVNIINDLIPEGAETIILTLNSPCSCLHPQEVLTILDYIPMVPLTDTITVCGPTGVGTVNVNIEGGVEPYTYQWSNGTTDPSLTAFVSQSTNFTVTVTDDCGKTKTAVARMIVTPAPTGQLLPPAPQICPGQSAIVQVNFTGTGPWELSYNLNYNSYGTISGITDDPYNLEITQPGLYTIAGVIDSFGCPGPGSGAINVTESTLSLTGVPMGTTCSNTNNGAINTTVVGGQGPYSYSWAGPTTIGNIADPSGLLPGTYNVTVTDGFGCNNTQTFNVLSPPPISPSASITGVNCYNTSGGIIDLAVSGGTPNYNYIWSNGATTQDIQNLIAGTYTVTVTDMNGCSRTSTAVVPSDITPPIATGVPDGTITCVTQTIPLDGAGSSSGSNFTYNWMAAPGYITNGHTTLNPMVNQGGNYILTVTNTTNGCTASYTVPVVPDNTPPVTNAGPDGTLTCVVNDITLNGAGSSSGSNFNYQWNATNGGTIQSGDTTLNPVVTTTGTYTLVITNTSNGCTSTDQALVNINTTNPTAVVAPGGQITCTNPSLQLSGAGSSTGANFSYEWVAGNGGGISFGGTTLTPTVTAAGTYTLIVTNTANGCTSTASTNVTINAEVPIAIAIPLDTITCSVGSVPISGNGSTVGTGLTYQWGTVGGQILSGQGTLQITAGAPGTYTLLVTNTQNNCTASYSTQVEADLAAPVADAGGQQILTCTQPTAGLDGSGSSTGNQFTYQWTAVSGGNFVSGANSQNPQIDAPGTYQIVVTNTANGCTSTDQVVVLPDANDPVVQIANPATLNCLVLQTQLNSGGSSTGTGISYNWSGPGIVSDPTGQNITVEQPGDYTLVISNSANGCTSEMTVNVPQNIVIPPADAGPDQILNCYDPQVQIGGPGNPGGTGFSFNWSGPGIVIGENTPGPLANQGGTYTVTVTNTVNGCTQTDEVVLTPDFVNPQAIGGPGFQLTCNQLTYTLQASGSTGSNFTYDWTTNTGSFASARDILNPTVNGSGTYTLLVTNTTNGCTASTSVVITQAADVPVAVANSAPMLTCATTSLTLSGAGSSTGNEFSYQWTATNGGNIVSNPNSLSPVINEPGTYTLVVFNTVNNCSNNSIVIVEEDVAPPAIDAGATPTITCSNTSVNLAGSVSTQGSFNYQWQVQGSGNIVTGGNTLTPTVNAAGTYLLTVTNTVNGCTSTDLATVDINQIPPTNVLQQPETLTCADETVTIDASGSSTGNMNYTWTTSGGNIVDQTNPLQPVVNAPGNYTLLITSTVNGCTASQTVTVPQDIVSPVAEAGAAGLLTCAVTSTQLNGNGSSQNGNFQYLWTTNDGAILSGAFTLTPTVASGGTYILQVTNNDNGCVSTDNVLVNTNTVAPNVVIATPGILTCLIPQVTLNGSGSPGGPNFNYQWLTSNGNIVGNSNNPTCIANLSGDYTLVVTNNQNGCSAEQTVAVTNNIILPDAEAGPPFTLTCTVEQVTLQGSGSSGANYGYAWSTSNGNILSGNNSTAPVVNQNGVYTLTVTNNSTGCTQTDTVEVLEDTNVPTDLAFDLVKPSCKDNDGMITFGAITGGTGPYLYSINGGQTFSPAIDFAQITPGTYNLFIQDANGCEYNEPLVVPQAPDPAIALDPTFSIELGDSLTLNAILPQGYPISLVDTIVWTPLDGLTFDSYSILDLLKPSAKPFKTTEYTVTLVSKDGCEDRDKVLIRVDNEPHIYIPNAFSPHDEDGHNDVFHIFADDKQILQIDKFQVYDRWGEMVFTDSNFQPNDPAHGWDGRLRGKLMVPAVFVYYAEIRLIDGRVLLYKGDVTLVQ